MFDIWILKAFQCKIYESLEAGDVLFYYNTYFISVRPHCPTGLTSNLFLLLWQGNYSFREMVLCKHDGGSKKLVWYDDTNTKRLICPGPGLGWLRLNLRTLTHYLPVVRTYRASQKKGEIRKLGPIQKIVIFSLFEQF